MAICPDCNQEMHEADGCILQTVPTIDGALDPIPYGKEVNPIMEAYRDGVPRRCGDCDAMPGFFHHPGCDIEECPRCHGQLFTCDCIEEAEEKENSPQGTK
jgi:hypothetical protein